MRFSLHKAQSVIKGRIETRLILNIAVRCLRAIVETGPAYGDSGVDSLIGF